MTDAVHMCSKCKSTVFTLATVATYYGRDVKVPECLQCGHQGKPEEAILNGNVGVKTGISRKVPDLKVSTELRLIQLRKDWLYGFNQYIGGTNEYEREYTGNFKRHARNSKRVKRG